MDRGKGCKGKGEGPVGGAAGEARLQLGCCDIRINMVAAWIDVALTPWHFPAQSERLHVKRQLVDVQVASSAFL